MKTRVNAFTLIELLVVVAIIALLISILLPSLAGAREQAKRAKCLANISAIGKGMQTYAAEDRRELLLPIHWRQASTAARDSGWYYRTVEWFMFGGKSAPEPFYAPNQVGTTNAPGQPRRIDDSGDYGAKSRPLNRYLYGKDVSGNTDPTPPATPTEGVSTSELPLYQCPSDIGYPEADQDIVDDSPYGNAQRPCYQTMGNSYRASLSGFHSDQTGFSMGVWGQRASGFAASSRQVLFGEPTWFNMIGIDSSNSAGLVTDPVVLTGWHKVFLVDNLAYADGSARPTRGDGSLAVDATTAGQMGLPATNAQLISRGKNWQVDSYPTPGAKIRGGFPGQAASVNIQGIGAVSTQAWPFAGARDLRRN